MDYNFFLKKTCWNLLFLSEFFEKFSSPENYFKPLNNRK